MAGSESGDAASDPTGSSPERRCLVTRETLPRGAMIRFVVGPDGSAVPDLEERLPGRGFWLRAERDVVNTACAKSLFSKAARSRVSAPDDLADRLEGLLAKRLIHLLGLARRAGQAVAGLQKVEDRLKAGKTAGRGMVLLQASDGSRDGCAKVRAWAPEARHFALLDATELGIAFGRDAAVHVVISGGRLVDLIARDAARLAGFRASPGEYGTESIPDGD